MITFSIIVAISLILLGLVIYSSFIYSNEMDFFEKSEADPRITSEKPVVPYETLFIFYDLLKEHASLDEIITIRKRRKQRVSDLYQKQQLVGTAVSKLYEEVNGIVNLNHKIITEHNSYYVVELLKKL